MTSMMAATGAKAGKFGVKTKNAEALAALQHNLKSDRIEFVTLGDFYPPATNTNWSTALPAA